MKHLNWLEILEAMEEGQRPSHLDVCPSCATRWFKAGDMLQALTVEERPSHDTEALVQRLMLHTQDKRPRSALKLKWALAAGVVLFVAGVLAFWQHRQSDLDRQYAAILAGDPMAAPAGLDTLLPSWSFTDEDPWLEDLDQFYEEKGE